jgi:uncharacterized protein
MFPFASLPENLAAFCDSLRRNHGFRIGPRELHDAARALLIAPLANERTVRDALRPILSHTRRDVLVFDEAFQAFFHPRPGARAAAESTRARADVSRGRSAKEIPAPSTERPEPELRGGGMASPRGTVVSIADVSDETASGARRLRLAYSPLEAESPSPMLEPPDAEWREAARLVVRRFEIGLSRRWRPAPRGARFDFRRTLRGTLQTGGEAMVCR